MNTPAQSPRTYTITVTHEERVIKIRRIIATDRRHAVYLAVQWFWGKYKGSIGPAHKALTIDDPYREVRYGPKFFCNDRLNKFLPYDVRHSLIRESKGEIVIDNRKGTAHHQPNSVMRVKRRRDFGRFIAPAIKRMKNGVLYYRINRCPQVKRGDKLVLKRKYQDIRLEAKTLESALGEIQMRELHKLHAEQSARKTKVRELPVLAHAMGLIVLKGKPGLSRALRRYERPPQLKSA